ncbi:Basement membrane-specific heparan sulfate proteoglycan core protein, partial [Bulinus truncatus]
RPSIETPPPYPSLYQYQSTIELRCNARGSPAPVIRWERQPGGNFPLQHQIRDGVLTIYNAQPEDSGLYVCTASNEGGTAQITYQVNVDGENLGLNQHVYNEGQTIELDCAMSKTAPVSSLKWSKVDGQISRHAQISNSMLILENATTEDSGTYRCTVTSAGNIVYVDITLKVQPGPVINYQDYTTAALGSPAQLRCDAVGYPQQVTWVKENGDLPSEHEVTQDGSLFIPRVKESDAGKYNCQAGRLVYPFYLVVGALVPYFSHSKDNSYLEYATLQDAYQDLDIMLSFRPESTDGLLLYNGQYVADSGDFVCFGLQQQVPEFRFDVGSGPAIIRGNRSLELNKWHTVHLKRNRRNGTLLVNDEPAYQGIAPGQHEGLDLGAPFYLGSVPDFNKIPRTVGYSKGLVGSVSQVQVKGVNMNLGAEAKSLKNVVQYDACFEERPCLNGGTCRPFNIRFGYLCECAPGFMGEKCELKGEACSPGLCGPQGRCVNLPRQRYSCICPAGLAGDGCRRIVEISDPAFNKTSFISYPKISDSLMSVHVELFFNPRSLDDGIILYNSKTLEGNQDFISLSIKNKFLEFRFNTGSGTAILKSRQPLRVNDWTRVVADRKGRDGMLIINNDEPINEQVAANDEQVYAHLARGDVVRGSTPSNKTVGLNLDRPLYLGGVDPAETINPGVNVTSGFVGCIGELTIGEKTFQLMEDALEMMNIQECGERTLCARKPCKNNARCVNRSPTEYFCECPSGFSGRNCEIRIDICVLQTPCLNGGQCVSLQKNRYRCLCPLGWSGGNCERAVRLATSARFNEDGHIEIDSAKFTHAKRGLQENFTITIETTESDGLILWQGQKPDEQKTSKSDFIALALVDGFVQFSYELGDGPGFVKSLNPVNDGYPHSIFVARDGKVASVTVDQEPLVSGSSRGSLKVLNVSGNLFLGGVPDFRRYTANMFNKNFKGCISNVRLSGKPTINFGAESKSGLNVSPCD